ncbi:MAG: TetR/AcrR family transcriptional regulator [Leptospirillum sp.]|jgi:AcrR family transcriptional regulator
MVVQDKKLNEFPSREIAFQMEKDRIIDQAANLFAQRRYDQVTLDELTQILGIGKGTLYRYFTNKEQLYAEILDLGHQKLMEILNGVKDREDINPLEKLYEMSFSMAHFIRLHLDIYKVMAIEEPKERQCSTEKVQQYRKERINMISDVVQEGRLLNYFRQDIDIALFSQSLMGALWVEAIFPLGAIEKDGRLILRIEEIILMFLKGVGTNQNFFKGRMI